MRSRVWSVHGGSWNGCGWSWRAGWSSRNWSSSSSVPSGVLGASSDGDGGCRRGFLGIGVVISGAILTTGVGAERRSVFWRSERKGSPRRGLERRFMRRSRGRERDGKRWTEERKKHWKRKGVDAICERGQRADERLESWSIVHGETVFEECGPVNVRKNES